jgi:hypothetical protein
MKKNVILLSIIPILLILSCKQIPQPISQEVEFEIKIQAIKKTAEFTLELNLNDSNIMNETMKSFNQNIKLKSNDKLEIKIYNGENSEIMVMIGRESYPLHVFIINNYDYLHRTIHVLNKGPEIFRMI